MIDSSVMKDILALNKDMLQFYNKRDYIQLEPISRLVNPNEYDLYLVVCALCNYSNDFLDQERLFKLRAELFSQLKPAYMYSHMSIDYETSSDKKKAYCTNPHRQNKYHLHELEIFGLTKEEAQSLWLYRDNISYVDQKDDKVVVSIRGANFYGFLDVLNIFDISYNIDELSEGIVFLNESNNTLVDYRRFSLPFEPYDFQIEDAKKIVAMKRALIGHEMGCIAGDGVVEILIDGQSKSILLAELNELFKTRKDIKILSFVANNVFQYMPIKGVLYQGKKQIMQVMTTHASLRCTLDHEILTSFGWKEAQYLRIDDELISTTEDCEKVTQILTLNTIEDVYDVIIDDLTIRNFVVNHVVVHNCGKTLISILVGASIFNKENVVYSTLDNLNYDDIVITDKGPLPIGKIVEENIDCKVQIIKDGIPQFVNILHRKCIKE